MLCAYGDIHDMRHEYGKHVYMCINICRQHILQHTATHCNTQNMIYMICVDIHDAHSEYEGDWQGGLRCGCVSFFTGVSV